MSSMTEKIVEIDSHIGCALSGLIADSKTMIDRARVEAQARQCGGFQECTVNMGETMTERGSGSCAALPCTHMSSIHLLFYSKEALLHSIEALMLCSSTQYSTAMLLLYISKTFQWLQL